MRASKSGPVVSISVGISVSILEEGWGGEELGGLRILFFLPLFLRASVEPIAGPLGIATLAVVEVLVLGSLVERGVSLDIVGC